MLQIMYVAHAWLLILSARLFFAQLKLVPSPLKNLTTSFHYSPQPTEQYYFDQAHLDVYLCNSSNFVEESSSLLAILSNLWSFPTSIVFLEHTLFTEPISSLAKLVPRPL
jgi:hypothetical protein